MAGTAGVDTWVYLALEGKLRCNWVTGVIRSTAILREEMVIVDSSSHRLLGGGFVTKGDMMGETQVPLSTRFSSQKSSYIAHHIICSSRLLHDAIIASTTTTTSLGLYAI